MKHNKNFFTRILVAMLAFSSIFAIVSCSEEEDDGPKIPVITDFNPKSGEVGTEVTITGNDLDGATSVTFNTTEAQIVSNTATELVTAVPDGATTGRITVTTEGGVAETETDFEVVVPNAPTVTRVNLISAEVGEEFIIIGQDMADLVSVEIGGVEGTIVSNNDTSVTVTASEGTPLGLTSLAVSNDAGTFSTSTDNIEFYIVEVFLTYGDNFDRDTLVWFARDDAELPSLFGLNTELQDSAGIILVPPIDNRYYHCQGNSDTDDSGSYAGQIFQGATQDAGYAADFLSGQLNEYYFNVHMNFGDGIEKSASDEELAGLRMRFDEGPDTDGDGSTGDEYIEFRPTPDYLAGLEPNSDGWYALNVPIESFTDRNDIANYDIANDMTRYTIALRREYNGVFTLSVDNVYLTRGGPYNFVNNQ